MGLKQLEILRSKLTIKNNECDHLKALNHQLASKLQVQHELKEQLVSQVNDCSPIA